MSARLIVHKIKSGFNLQSLCIMISDNDDTGSEIKFSNWTDGQSEPSQKHTEKSRLVVKIVSENERTNEPNFDLEACAHEVVSTVSPINNKNKDLSLISEAIYLGHYKSNGSESIPFDKQTNETEIISGNSSVLKGAPSLRQQKKYFHNTNTQTGMDTSPSNRKSDQAMGPLEYSLEKVKRNNARIMENIQMLNRTLNYTKKNEILNTACSKSLRSYPCTICGKCFVYETGLKRHYSLRHSLTEVQPRWQIVWTCVECFQVWPRHDFALRHAGQCNKSGSTDCVREIKTSSLLQCEFCEKVFTSIPRLLRHSKTHTTARNYECNACELNFWSYKGAEQHMALCPWQTICYKFSLSKLLLCNACDRKFRTYEQLYNHRYKVGHFTTKAFSDPIKSLMSFVYQCELCGQSFPSIPTLQVHRTQYHPRFEDDPQILRDIGYNEHCNGTPFKQVED